jgi:hypothetical protein
MSRRVVQVKSERKSPTSKKAMNEETKRRREGRKRLFRSSSKPKRALHHVRVAAWRRGRFMEKGDDLDYDVVLTIWN